MYVFLLISHLLNLDKAFLQHWFFYFLGNAECVIS